MKIIIVGGGQTGSYLATLLIERGHEVRIIEQREARLPVLRRDLPAECVVHGSGADPATLEAAGIRRADALAAVTGADETNLVVATIARLEYGIRRVVGRVNNPKNAWLFNATMGVDAALNQADLMAHLVAEEMTMGDMMTLLKLHNGKYSLVERLVGADSPVAGKRIRDLQLPRECILVAVMRGEELILPRGDTELFESDSVVAIVQASSLEEFQKVLGPGKPNR